MQFEIRKKIVFKQGYKTRALIFYTIILQKQTINKIMQIFIIRNEKYRCYVSFSDTVPNDKLRYLYLNEINNVDGRFKTLNNVNADDNSMINEE